MSSRKGAGRTHRTDGRTDTLIASELRTRRSENIYIYKWHVGPGSHTGGGGGRRKGEGREGSDGGTKGKRFLGSGAKRLAKGKRRQAGGSEIFSIFICDLSKE